MTLSENHIFSPALLNAFRASFSRTGFITQSVRARHDYVRYGAVHWQHELSVQLLADPKPTVRNRTAATTKQNILSWSDDIFWTKGKTRPEVWHADQSLRARHADQFLYAWSNHLPLDGGLSSGTGTEFCVFTPPTSNANRYFLYNTFGFYAQDDIRVNPRFTLESGGAVRVQYNAAGNERTPVPISTLCDGDSSDAGTRHPECFSEEFRPADRVSPGTCLGTGKHH